MRSHTDLIEKLLKGDSGAASELVELAAPGEAVALAALRSTGNRGAPEADPEHPEHEDAWHAAFWDRLHQLLRLADADPRSALPAARKALLEPLGACYRARVLGLLAYIQRSLGDVEEAESTLGLAWDLSASCPASRLDLLRRRGLLAAARGRRAAGLADVDQAVLGYRSHGSPGHDLHGNGLASSLYARANIRHVMDDNTGAAEDLAECLSLVSKTSVLFEYAVVNLAAALYKSGRASQLEALPLIALARKRFKGVGQRSVQRAHLDWLEGVLKWELRRQPLCRAVNRVRRAASDFAVLGLPAQTVGAASDLCRIYSPNLGEIREFVAVLRPRFDALDLSSLSATVHRRLDRLYDALESGSLNARLYVDQAVANLRRAISGAPGVFPCLLTR